MTEKDVYLSTFANLEKVRGHAEPSWLHSLRTAAIDRFAELGFPSLRDEDWRFTNLAPLVRIPFQPAEPAVLEARDVAQADRLAYAQANTHRLVFVNGFFAPRLSTLGRLPDAVYAGSLAQTLREQPEQVEPHLAHYAGFDDHPFRALNTAFFRDGAFVSVGAGRVVEEPIHLIFISTAGHEPAVAHPRNLLVTGSGSALTVVETYLGLGEGPYFTNAVTEMVLADGALVDHYKVQRETVQAFHMASLQVQQQRKSTLSSHAITLGGGLVRNEIGAVLGAEGCECTLNGLYLGTGRQHLDNRTTIEHAMPRCASHELYKGILDGKAHGVFNGKICVRQDAQKTDAKQTNQTLLLSEDATINTKPQLEICADDVKCTHGATVGQLDPESLFYLRTRGIDLAAARSLLTFAFANDIVERIKVAPLRAGLEDYLLASQQLAADRDGKEEA